MVGSLIVERLTQKSKLDYEIITRSHKEIDLTNQSKIRDFFYDVNLGQFTCPLCQDTCPLSNLSIQTKAGGGK